MTGTLVRGVAVAIDAGPGTRRASIRRSSKPGRASSPTVVNRLRDAPSSTPSTTSRAFMRRPRTTPSRRPRPCDSSPCCSPSRPWRWGVAGPAGLDRAAEARLRLGMAVDDLYRGRPGAKAHVEGAPGYAVFSSLGSKIVVVATGNGFGVATNTETGENTYIRMVEACGGIGTSMARRSTPRRRCNEVGFAGFLHRNSPSTVAAVWFTRDRNTSGPWARRAPDSLRALRPVRISLHATSRVGYHRHDKGLESYLRSQEMNVRVSCSRPKQMLSKAIDVCWSIEIG